MGPHSTETVKRSDSPSSAATEPMPPGIPMPRLMRESGRGSITARRRQIFRGPMARGHLLRGDLGQTGNLRAEPVVGKTLVAVLRAALHQVIHHEPVDEDLFGRNGAPFDNLIHLGNDNAAGVVDGGRHLKLLHVHGLIADGEVACLVPIGGAEEADIQGKGPDRTSTPFPPAR